MIYVNYSQIQTFQIMQMNKKQSQVNYMHSPTS